MNVLTFMSASDIIPLSSLLSTFLSFDISRFDIFPLLAFPIRHFSFRHFSVRHFAVRRLYGQPLEALTFCQFSFTANQMLAQTSIVQFELTRIINRTAGLSTSDSITYSGLWHPMSIVQTLSDDLFFEMQGEHLRYLSAQANIIVQLSGTPFYVKNTQDPIARRTEIIIFHNILFTTVALELFGLVFLIFKLIFLPLFSLVYQNSMQNRVGPYDDDDEEEEKNSNASQRFR